MKPRVRSGKTVLIRLFCVLAAVTLGCFVICGAYSLANTQRELAYCNEAALDVFCTALEYTSDDLESFNENLLTSGVAFDLLGVQENVPAEQLLLSELNAQVTGVHAENVGSLGMVPEPVLFFCHATWHVGSWLP